MRLPAYLYIYNIYNIYLLYMYIALLSLLQIFQINSNLVCYADIKRPASQKRVVLCEKGSDVFWCNEISVVKKMISVMRHMSG